MITDVELEPGERVENYVVSDPGRWSISAAWSGNLDDLVTHVLLRTLFPGLKTNVMIYTDRRAYSLSVESSETGQHTSRVAFNYLVPKDMAAEIPPGEWRDLLEQYDLLPEGSKDSGLAKRRTGSQNLIDGADIYFHYIIRQSSGSAGRRIDWIPVAVYDANGKTYIAMPQKMTPRPGAHSLRIKRGDRDLPGTYKVLKDNLYVVDRLFDFGILSFGGNSVEIRRADPASEN
jgi:type IV secretion system protein VirB9